MCRRSRQATDCSRGLTQHVQITQCLRMRSLEALAIFQWVSSRTSVRFERDVVSAGAEKPHAGPAEGRPVGKSLEAFAYHLPSPACRSCTEFDLPSCVLSQATRAAAPALATQGHRYASGE